ncbi:MAG: asparagine synthase (glutamine-hydrolyzing) [Caldilineaceae bacterium]
MCGICGIIYINGTDQGDLSPLIEQMTDTLIHRGPNDCGTWQSRGIALGSRRLSIIDLSEAGRMPMSNEDGSVQIVYNGEIYNFRALRERFALDRKGHIFRSKTDTEVLVHLYEELGLDMMRELNGMFAIAIWDQNKQRLYLARDAYGIKPLFYQQDQQCFRFGSEIKAILADRRVIRKPSRQAMHDFLTFNYIPGAQTAFEEIYEVPPGHWMTISRHGAHAPMRYYDIYMDPNKQIDEKTAICEAKQLMEQAVQRQLVADVPIGVLLSGGMDSSTIAALMNQHVSGAIHTYSIGFREESFNELSYAYRCKAFTRPINR